MDHRHSFTRLQSGPYVCFGCGEQLEQPEYDALLAFQVRELTKAVELLHWLEQRGYILLGVSLRGYRDIPDPDRASLLAEYFGGQAPEGRA